MIKSHKVSSLLCLFMTLSLGCRRSQAPLDSAVQADTSDDEGGLQVECVETSVEPGPVRPFTHPASKALAAKGTPLHSGRDLMVRQGDAIPISAAFTYGISGAELGDEEVDVYFLRACGVDWEKLGVFKTGAAVAPATKATAASSAGESRAGRISFELNQVLKQKLDPGHYRLQFFVGGDRSSTELALEVLAKDGAIVVTDIDGTLTLSDLSNSKATANGSPSRLPGSAELLQTFFKQGYAIAYLNVRPEWMTQASREWLEAEGFPPGVVIGSQERVKAAAELTFKKQALEQLKAATKRVPCFAFGSKLSDVQSYQSAGISPGRTYFYGLVGDSAGGTVHSNYKNLSNIADFPVSSCPKSS